MDRTELVVGIFMLIENVLEESEDGRQNGKDTGSHMTMNSMIFWTMFFIVILVLITRLPIPAAILLSSNVLQLGFARYIQSSAASPPVLQPWCIFKPSVIHMLCPFLMFRLKCCSNLVRLTPSSMSRVSHKYIIYSQTPNPLPDQTSVYHADLDV